MNKNFKTVAESQVTMSLLMLPSHSNFSGKIHGGFILSLLDQIAFASASKFSGHYCVTASVDTVDFLNPIDVGELVTLKACVNFVGKTSMIVGIRVEAENIQSGEIKHCNSSYFTMVAKDELGKPTQIPGLRIKTKQEYRRFLNALNRKKKQKEINNYKVDINYNSEDLKNELSQYNVIVENLI
ncbi:hotdog domain-containing protein [Flavobacterium capsici]|uniref:Hotdog domain-containing protein n=1 Tax=Flavobacterium capsici TaxID=3075618 RepID=A0AA96J283_9FLAO|nr:MULTISPECIES: hotdog domain-containing protein [unclassified Flavobacterium]WNM18810.1 hotdog domain-containing protein [Flavobacterium sp. PMR2A8]WNM22861.1 hotdog domain-containing protein [Flavobacterium sp. PMTSA4]